MTAEKAHVHEEVSFASQKLRKLSKISIVGGLGDGHSCMMTLVYVGLTHCGVVTSYGVVDIGQQIVSGNGLSHVRRQSITWTKCWRVIQYELSRTNFNELWIKIPSFSFREIYLKVSSAKWRPFCPCLNSLEVPITLHQTKQSLLV